MIKISKKIEYLKIKFIKNIIANYLILMNYLFDNSAKYSTERMLFVCFYATKSAYPYGFFDEEKIVFTDYDHAIDSIKNCIDAFPKDLITYNRKYDGIDLKINDNLIKLQYIKPIHGYKEPKLEIKFPFINLTKKE